MNKYLIIILGVIMLILCSGVQADNILWSKEEQLKTNSEVSIVSSFSIVEDHEGKFLIFYSSIKNITFSDQKGNPITHDVITCSSLDTVNKKIEDDGDNTLCNNLEDGLVYNCYACGSPSIIQDTENRFWITWESIAAGSGISSVYYGIYDDKGKPIIAPIRSSTVSGYTPHIFQDSDKKIWLLWSDDDGIKASKTKESELKFPLEQIDMISGNVTIGKLERIKGDILIPRNQLGLLGSPKIVQDSSNKYYLIWASGTQEGSNLYYKISDDGEAWSEEKQLTESFANYNPYVALVDNKIWVVWDSKRTGNREIFYKFFDTTTKEWSNDTQLTTTTANNFNPSIVQDSEGKVWIVFVSDRSGKYDIWYITGEIKTNENTDKKEPKISNNTIDNILTIVIMVMVVLLSIFVIYYKKIR